MTLGIGFGLWHFFRVIERGSVIGSNPLPPHASPPVLTDFLNLSQSGERPKRYVEPRRFDTIPSSPILQACSERHGTGVVLKVLVQPLAWSALAQDAR